MNHDIEGIERATLDAVAPPKVVALPDWLLPLDQSTIGRAISAVPLRHDQLQTRDLARIEDIYHQAGRQARFRLADVIGLRDIQAALHERGYRPHEPTLTQTIAIGSLIDRASALSTVEVHLSQHPDPAWKSVYLAPCFDAEDGANRVQALSRSPHIIYAWVQSEGQALAAGTASMSHGWLGVHGMRTVAAARGLGMATQLIAKLASHGQTQGYTQAFLQVHESSLAAIALYQRLGFQTAWRYHYWIQGESSA